MFSFIFKNCFSVVVFEKLDLESVDKHSYDLLLELQSNVREIVLKKCMDAFENVILMITSPFDCFCFCVVHIIANFFFPQDRQKEVIECSQMLAHLDCGAKGLRLHCQMLRKSLHKDFEENRLILTATYGNFIDYFA